MDNVRPRASSFSPPKGFFNIRTVDRPKSPKPIIKSKWVKKESTTIVPIEDSNSKALVEKDSQGEIDWTKEFDDDPVTFAMVALNGIKEDDWSIEIDADHVDLGQDGLGILDWSEEADNAPIALALMATSSTDSSNSKGNPEEDLKDYAIIDSGCSGSGVADYNNMDPTIDVPSTPILRIHKIHPQS
ncbi:hypothetical protein Tco_0181185 [Tanacetum coccineum]